GWTRSVHMFSQSRGKVAFDEASQNFLPGRSHDDERSAGACRGVFDFGEVIDDGFAAGHAAARAAGATGGGLNTFDVDGATAPIPKVGLTTFRPPYTPTTFGLFAGTSRGDLFDPVRKTSTHDWAAEHGAAFEDVGLWKRAWYFARGAETMHEAVNRECRTVRT